MKPTYTLKQRVSQISIAAFVVTSIVVLTSFILYSIKKAKIAEDFVQKELLQNIKEQHNLFVPSFLLPEHTRGLDILLDRIKINENLEKVLVVKNESDFPDGFSKCELKHTLPTTCSSSDLNSTALVYPLIEEGEHFGFLFKSKKNISPSSIKDIIEITIIIISVFAAVFFVIYYFIVRLLSTTLPSALDELVKWIEADLAGVKTSISLPFKELDDLKTKISEVMDVYNKSAKKTIKYELSRQLVHDIRNPLETIESLMTLSGKRSLSEEENKLVIACTSRIGQLANSLLFMEKPVTLDYKNFEFELNSTVKSCVDQRASSFSGQKIDFKFYNDSSFEKLFVKGDELDFYRALNNILKNACESFENTIGDISVEIKKLGSEVEVSISDNGKGITPAVVKRIQEGGYTDKIHGSGLGLKQVKETVNSMGGRFLIKSQVGAGTTISIVLPIFSETKVANYVLIDDDKLIRHNWKIHADKLKVGLLCFDSVESFISEHESISKETIICIDSCLQNGVKGEEISSQIFSKGFRSIYLATSLSNIETTNYPWISKVVGKKPLFAN